MDKYKPITGELRGTCELAAPKIEIDGTVRFNKVDFNYKQFIDLCDNIDSVHAELERENARLKAERDSMAAALDAAQGEHAFAPESHYVMLPKDADGVPIHVGDVLTDGECIFKVFELAAFKNGSWSIRNVNGKAWATCTVTHYHEPTVEDVLREVVTLCHNTWKEGSAFEFYDVDDVMESGNIAEYAAKLCLAGEK